MIEVIFAGISPTALIAAIAVTFVAGVIKGALGFAMPMIMISGLSSFLPVELALAGLILPTLFTNLSQALRQGILAAWGSVATYWRMLLAMVVMLLISAQMVGIIPERALLALLGGPIAIFALLQLMKVPLALRVEKRHRAEWWSGAIGGLYGGVSGIWGPPVMVYLISLDTNKRDMVRILGVVFLIGGISLLIGHSMSGVLYGGSMAFSAVLVVPGMIGLWLGYIVQDRLDADRFRRWTLFLLIVTGLNLLRQAALY